MKKSILKTMGITLLVIAVASCRKEDAGGVDAIQNRSLSSSQSAISGAQKRALLNGVDSNYLIITAEGSSSEIVLGELAQRHASAQIIKDFGQRMIDDHSKQHHELKQVAQSFGITVPDHPSEEQQQEFNELSKYYGSSFDKRYIAYEVHDHRTDIDDAKNEIFYGRNENVENLAIEWTPILIVHLELAEDAAKKVGAKY